MKLALGVLAASFVMASSAFARPVEIKVPNHNGPEPLCLKEKSGEPFKNNIVVRGCNNEANEIFEAVKLREFVNPAGDVIEIVKFKSLDGRCFDMTGNTPQPGVSLQLYRCKSEAEGDGNQRFELDLRRKEIRPLIVHDLCLDAFSRTVLVRRGDHEERVDNIEKVVVQKECYLQNEAEKFRIRYLQ